MLTSGEGEGSRQLTGNAAAAHTLYDDAFRLYQEAVTRAEGTPCHLSTSQTHPLTFVSVCWVPWVGAQDVRGLAKTHMRLATLADEQMQQRLEAGTAQDDAVCQAFVTSCLRVRFTTRIADPFIPQCRFGFVLTCAWMCV